MVTPLDKAIVAFLLPLLAWVNQKYGFSFPVDANNLTLIVGGIAAGLVYVIPNKQKGN